MSKIEIDGKKYTQIWLTKVEALLAGETYAEVSAGLRELVQNAVDTIGLAIQHNEINPDAMDNYVTIKVDKKENGISTMVIHDRGQGMSEEVVNNKYVKLAQTTKEESDTVGGIGIGVFAASILGDTITTRTTRDGMQTEIIFQKKMGRHSILIGDTTPVDGVENGTTVKIFVEKDIDFKKIIAEVIFPIPETFKIKVEYNGEDISDKFFRMNSAKEDGPVSVINGAVLNDIKNGDKYIDPGSNITQSGNYIRFGPSILPIPTRMLKDVVESVPLPNGLLRLDRGLTYSDLLYLTAINSNGFKRTSSTKIILNATELINRLMREATKNRNTLPLAVSRDSLKEDHPTLKGDLQIAIMECVVKTMGAELEEIRRIQRCETLGSIVQVVGDKKINPMCARYMLNEGRIRRADLLYSDEDIRICGANVKRQLAKIPSGRWGTRSILGRGKLKIHLKECNKVEFFMSMRPKSEKILICGNFDSFPLQSLYEKKHTGVSYFDMPPNELISDVGLFVFTECEDKMRQFLIDAGVDKDSIMMANDTIIKKITRGKAAVGADGEVRKDASKAITIFGSINGRKIVNQRVTPAKIEKWEAEESVDGICSVDIRDLGSHWSIISNIESLAADQSVNGNINIIYIINDGSLDKDAEEALKSKMKINRAVAEMMSSVQLGYGSKLPATRESKKTTFLAAALGLEKEMETHFNGNLYEHVLASIEEIESWGFATREILAVNDEYRAIIHQFIEDSDEAKKYIFSHPIIEGNSVAVDYIKDLKRFTDDTIAQGYEDAIHSILTDKVPTFGILTLIRNGNIIKGGPNEYTRKEAMAKFGLITSIMKMMYTEQTLKDRIREQQKLLQKFAGVEGNIKKMLTKDDNGSKRGVTFDF